MKNTTRLASILVLALALGAPSGQARELDFLPDEVVPTTTVISEETGELVFDFDASDALEAATAQAWNAPKYRLAEEAAKLTKLSRADYLKIQKTTVGSVFPACNFFLITALCKAGYCEEGKPFFKAASFDGYFRSNGWKEVTIASIKSWLLDNRDFDAVFQRDGRSGRGHVMIPIGVTAEGRIRFAQGNHGKATNEVVTFTPQSVVSQGYRAFVKF